MNGSRLLPLCIGVLIDTWWNVNITCSNGYKLNAQVLIDTWWNVN